MKCKRTKCNEIAVSNGYCDIHFREKEQKDRRVKELKEKGICVACGKMPSTATNALCIACSSKKNAKDKETRQKLHDNGICNHCYKMPVVPTRSFCEICWYKKVSSRHFGSNERWEELQLLFNKQNVCPLSNIKLKAGLTATLDHIIPISRAKEFGLIDYDHISNLQWVYMSEDGIINLNIVKNKLTQNEFENLTNLIGWRLEDKIRTLEEENSRLKRLLEK